jgi:hypothetical protein
MDDSMLYDAMEHAAAYRIGNDLKVNTVSR